MDRDKLREAVHHALVNWEHGSPGTQTEVVMQAIWPEVRTLLGTIVEYEHALELLAEGHSKLPPPYNTPDCADCMRLAQGALDGVNREDFKEWVDGS